MTTFFQRNANHELAEYYYNLYHNSLKKIIVEIAVQNPELVSKYERELIINLRLAIINEMIRLYGSAYEIMSR